MLGQNRQIRVLRTLGEGGFGAVHLVEIAGPDGFVQRAALKVLHQAMLGHGDVAGRQRDEARLLAQLNHDHIVKVLDLGDYEGRPAVLMEYVDGIDAHGLLQRGVLPPRVVMEIVAAAASALDAASTAMSPNTGKALRVVHRDIKPANLLVTAQGGVKVLDFGVARADFDREGATRSVLFGTVRYMAPEMWLEGSSSPAVDVYALGVTAIELLGAGSNARPPLHPTHFQRHVEETLAALSLAAEPDWADDLRALLRAMLSYEPGDRPRAAQVHDRASELAERAAGPPLRRWARQVLPPLLTERQQRAGPTPPPEHTHFSPVPPPAAAAGGETPRKVISLTPVDETVAERVVSQADPPAPSRAAPATMDIEAAAPTLIPVQTIQTAVQAAPTRSWRGLAMAGGLLVVVGAGAIWLRPAPAPEEQPTAAPPVIAEEAGTPPVEAPPPTPEPVQAPAPAEVAVLSEPAAAPASPRRTPTAPPVAVPAPEAEAVAAAEPIPAPAAASPLACASGPGRVALSFSSSPLGAEVWMDGSRLGTTPLAGCGLPEGRHMVTLRAQGLEATHEVRVSSRAARSFVWIAASDRWDVVE